MNLLEIIYYIPIIYTMVLLFYYVRVFKGSSNYHYPILLCCNIVFDLGCMFINFANDIGEAYAGTRLMYFSGIFMCYVLFRFVSEVCKVNVPKWFNNILTIVSFLAVAGSMTVGRNQWFYKKVEMVKTNYYTYLVKEYGFLHEISSKVLMVYMIFSILVAGYALLTPTIVSRKMASILALTGGLSTASYFGSKILNLRIETMPFTYMVSMAVVTYVVRQVYLYDTTRISSELDEKYKNNGFVLFDKGKRYLGSNNVAKQIITEMVDYYVGSTIGSEYDYKKYFDEILDEYTANNGKLLSDRHFTIHDEVYHVRVLPLEVSHINSNGGMIVQFLKENNYHEHLLNDNANSVEV